MVPGGMLRFTLPQDGPSGGEQEGKMAPDSEDRLQDVFPRQSHTGKLRFITSDMFVIPQRANIGQRSYVFVYLLLERTTDRLRCIH